MGFITHHEVKWGLIGDGVRMVIVSKFGIGDIIGPGSGVVPTEDSKVDFNFLIYLFGFSIQLGMVDSGE